MLGKISRMWMGWQRRLVDLRADSAKRSALAHEIACLDRASELDGVLSSLGFGRGAVPFLVRSYPGAMRRHSAMKRRLGIAGLSGYGLSAMSRSQRRCLLCPSAHRCEQWLRGGGARLPSFCANRPAFGDRSGPRAPLVR